MLMDSNSSPLYTHTSDGKKGDIVKDILKGNGYEDIVEKSSNSQCFKMRHAAGGQPQKFCEFMFDTIDKIVVHSYVLTGEIIDIPENVFKKYNPKLKDTLTSYRDPTFELKQKLEKLCINGLQNESTDITTKEVFNNLAGIYPNISAPSDHPPCCAEISFVRGSKIKSEFFEYLIENLNKFLNEEELTKIKKRLKIEFFTDCNYKYLRRLNPCKSNGKFEKFYNMFGIKNYELKKNIFGNHKHLFEFLDNIVKTTYYLYGNNNNENGTTNKCVQIFFYRNEIDNIYIIRNPELNISEPTCTNAYLIAKQDGQKDENDRISQGSYGAIYKLGDDFIYKIGKKSGALDGEKKFIEHVKEKYNEATSNTFNDLCEYYTCIDKGPNDFDIIIMKNAGENLKQVKRKLYQETIPPTTIPPTNWTIKDKKNLINQLEQKLNNLHDNLGVFHLDIKPENICVKMVNGEKVYTYIDYGLMIIPANVSKEKKVRPIVHGTGIYMSPYMAMQQIKNITPLNDWKAIDRWSLGVTIYEFLFDESADKLPNIIKEFDDLKKMDEFIKKNASNINGKIQDTLDAIKKQIQIRKNNENNNENKELIDYICTKFLNLSCKIDKTERQSTGGHDKLNPTSLTEREINTFKQFGNININERCKLLKNGQLINC
jgi:serine/threonine protein kinase